jgi:outer membrane protein OmpA-like peptidoglycan-associated protein
VKWFLASAAAVILAGAVAYSIYQGEVRLKAMDRRIAELTAEVNEASQMAKEESVAASAASQRATEAASRAEVAAGARAQAEQQREQAKAGQAHAESTARLATEQASLAETQLDALRKQREEELNQMQQALSRVVETRRTANGMVMVLPDSMFKFDFDRSDLKPRNRELLSRIAGILLVSKGYGLSVFGYTDDIGTKEYNQKLSERRAEAVRDYLVQAGIDPSIINTKGYGKTNPRVAGETEEARAKNRRVEIALTDSEIRYILGPDVGR